MPFMKVRQIILFIVVATTLFGFGYERIEINGHVIDSNIKNPVDNVKITYRDEVTFSDAAGNFQLIIDNDHDTARDELDRYHVHQFIGAASD